MICPNCGYNNEDTAKFCRKCGYALNNYANLRNVNTYSQYNSPNEQKNNNNVIIICITLIAIALILAGTFFLLSNNNGDLPFSLDNSHENSQDSSNTQVNTNTQDNQKENTVSNELNVNTASFYLDGNPNTGITSTINVGKEHTGETMGVITTFSRDGVVMNHVSDYESCVVDEDGNLVFTDYTPIPKYPDYCRIEIRYNNQIFIYGCDMGKHKGTQTSVPQEIS